MARVEALLFEDIPAIDFLGLETNKPYTSLGRELLGIVDFYDCEFFYTTQNPRGIKPTYKLNRGVEEENKKIKFPVALRSKRKFNKTKPYWAIECMRNAIKEIFLNVDYIRFSDFPIIFYDSDTNEVLYHDISNVRNLPRIISPENSLHNSRVIRVGMPRTNPNALRS